MSKGNETSLRITVSAGLMFAFVFLLSWRTHAFDIFPEFHALTESEASRLDRTTKIDSEYQSDQLTYTFPVAWDESFQASRNALQMTLGSLSLQLFLQHTRLKLETPLRNSISFRFVYFQQRDLDVDQTHAVFELTREFGAFAVSVYGEPSAFKRENDFGLALTLRPGPGHELRLFHTWVDFTRGAHNDEPDYFMEGKEPRSYGLTGKAPFGLSYHVRIESPTSWRLSQRELDYHYENSSVGFSLRRPWMNDDAEPVIVNVRAQRTKKSESFIALDPSSADAAGSLTSELDELLATVEFANCGLEPGLGWFHRTWEGSDQTRLEHRNLLPHVWWRVIHGVREERTDDLAIGYEATVFTSSGSPELAAEGLKAWSVEHRANLRYSISFTDPSSGQMDAELSLTATADLDAAVRGSGGLFEGGQGTFRARF